MSNDLDRYLRLIRDLQVKCAELSWQSFPNLGERASALIQALGVLLEYLKQAATCCGGCRNADHRAELLTARTVSSCQAALLLMTNGYYDEALSIIRSLGEIVNLMAMFVCNVSEFERWKAVDEKTRRREFSPVKVRLWLEKNNGPLVINQNLYGFLSSYSTHASPDVLPQNHNKHNKAIIGPIFQEAGLLLCLNELARSMAFVGVFSTKLIGVPNEVRDGAHIISRVLIENLSAITADNRERPWFNLG
jgi:hypothetical protein